MNSPYTPPGWYPDAYDSRWERYWDGRTWTPATRPAPAATWPTYSPTRPVRPERSVSWWQTWWTIGFGLVICAPFGLVGLWTRRGVPLALRWGLTGATAVLVLLVAVAPGPEQPPAPAAHDRPATPVDAPVADPVDDPVDAEPDPAVVTTEPVEAEEEPVVAPVRPQVPDLVGLDLHDARRALRAAGLVLGEVTRRPSAAARGSVLHQGRRHGSRVLDGATVPVVVAAALPVVPAVVATGVDGARRRLEQLGFRVRIVREDVTSGATGAVLRQSPGTGAARPGSRVTLVVAHLVVLPVADPGASGGSGGSCTPGYDPCLAPASDYDCAGGSGDGPGYTGTVRVTGDDPYGLDTDGDGTGCDS